MKEKHFPLNSLHGGSFLKSTLLVRKTRNYVFIEARSKVWEITKLREMQMLDSSGSLELSFIISDFFCTSTMSLPVYFCG